MDVSALWRTVRFLVPVVAFVMVSGQGPADAACYGAEQQLPAQATAQFTADPALLLSQYGNGGPQMISLVRDLVASDPQALPLILDLVPHANEAQLQAIGTALGEAALACVRPDQAFANDIQQMVVAINNRTLHVAFAAVLGDQNLAAVDPGGVGGGGGPTGDPSTTSGVGFNSSGPNLITSVVNVPDHFTIFSGSGSTPANSSNSAANGAGGSLITTTITNTGTPGNGSNSSVSPSSP
jgi:hypothetical protein